MSCEMMWTRMGEKRWEGREIEMLGQHWGFGIA